MTLLRGRTRCLRTHPAGTRQSNSTVCRMGTHFACLSHTCWISCVSPVDTLGSCWVFVDVSSRHAGRVIEQALYGQEFHFPGISSASHTCAGLHRVVTVDARWSHRVLVDVPSRHMTKVNQQCIAWSNIQYVPQSFAGFWTKVVCVLSVCFMRHVWSRRVCVHLPEGTLHGCL